MIIGVIFSYNAVEAKRVSLNQDVEKVTASYDDVFTDENKTMIIKDLDKEKYKNTGLSRKDLPESIDQSDFDQWQMVLDRQFQNQENAKESVVNLIEEINGKPYVKSDLSEEDFVSAKSRIKEPFNDKYQASLLNRVSILESDWKQIYSIEEKIAVFTKTLNDSSSKSLTVEDWDILEQEISKVINPNIQSNLTEHFESLSNKWEKLEEQRIVEEKKQYEEQKLSEKLKLKEEKTVAETTNTSNKSSKSKSKHSSTTNDQSNTSSSQISSNKKISKPVNKSNPSIGPNKIGVGGVYKNYTNYGNSSTSHYQSGIDAGLIIAGFSHFNGNDSETTYFAGHNPGIMNFIEQGIHLGAVVTVTDSAGEEFKYQMIDKVDVDDIGNGILHSIGKSAIDAYYYGTGTESILIQFCNSDNGLMSFWYGTPI